MATQNSIEPSKAVQQAAAHLMEIDWIDPDTAKQISPIAEAVANMVTVVYYQADTGLANRDDFRQAQVILRQAIPSPV
jgi:hypothetical protein